MSGVIRRFFFTSALMWVAPLAILYGFNHKVLPGSSQLSPSSQTLLSGFLAVISVNLVIVMYIIMALKEPPTSEPQPDPTFLADAKASISQSVATKKDDSAQRNSSGLLSSVKWDGWYLLLSFEPQKRIFGSMNSVSEWCIFLYKFAIQRGDRLHQIRC